jgi:hypothetical protein
VALEECAAARLEKRNSSQPGQIEAHVERARGRDGGEHPESCSPEGFRGSGLAVSKTRAEARSHAENAVAQFRQRSQAMEVQYRAPSSVEFF